MGDGTTYPYTDDAFTYLCPDMTGFYDVWEEESITDLGGDVKSCTGAGCTAAVDFSGTEGILRGAVGTQGATWGCKIDKGEYTWYEADSESQWNKKTLCDFKNLEDGEHTLTISNTPKGMSPLVVLDLQAKSGDTDGETAQAVDFSSIDKPISTTQKNTYIAPSTTSTASSSSSSAGPSKTDHTTASAVSHISENNVASTAISTSISLGPSSEGGGGSATTMTLIGVGLALLVVLCLFIALYFNTKPKKGREGSGLLSKRRDRSDSDSSDDEKSLGVRGSRPRPGRRRQQQEASPSDSDGYEQRCEDQLARPATSGGRKGRRGRGPTLRDTGPQDW